VAARSGWKWQIGRIPKVLLSPILPFFGGASFVGTCCTRKCPHQPHGHRSAINTGDDLSLDLMYQYGFDTSHNHCRLTIDLLWPDCLFGRTQGLHSPELTLYRRMLVDRLVVNDVRNATNAGCYSSETVAGCAGAHCLHRPNHGAIVDFGQNLAED
jgi:hypothetical protein